MDNDAPPTYEPDFEIRIRVRDANGVFAEQWISLEWFLKVLDDQLASDIHSAGQELLQQLREKGVIGQTGTGASGSDSSDG